MRAKVNKLPSIKNDTFKIYSFMYMNEILGLGENHCTEYGSTHVTKHGRLRRRLRRVYYVSAIMYIYPLAYF